jgi:hypothetical protein
VRVVLSVLVGALVGLAWYRLVGCRSGACGITSSPTSSALYGGMMGYIAARP